MTASIDVQGLDRLLGRLVKVRSGALQEDLVDNLHRAAGPIHAEMKGHAFTRVQRRAMDSVDVNRISNGLELSGGGGGSLGAVLFHGAEFGGRKPQRVVYLTRSPRGRSYSVRRRTTMQFLPHLGHEGYFFWPTVRDWLPKLHEQATKIVTDSLGGR